MAGSKANKFPWEQSIATEDLLRQLIADADETEKVEFKLSFDLHGGKQEKNELLLDIACIANSYSSDHDNHGFLILGVDPNTKEIKGADLNKETLTTHIDERMTKFLSPHVKFSVELYDTKDGLKKWGAIIIKPGIELPHVFISDTAEFIRGTIWVRKGSHKCLADPTDYSRFFAIRTESLKRDLDQLEAKVNFQDNDFKKRMETLEKKYKILATINRGPVQKKEREKISLDEAEAPHLADQRHRSAAPIESEQDLLALVKKELPKQSPLKTSLLNEVHAGMVFLESDEIPWSLRIGPANKQEALDAIQKIQSRFESFYKALFELVYFGDKEEHSELILIVVQKLAKRIHRGGVPYDALYVRYLPLVTTLYIISIAAVHKKSGGLLKKVVSLDLHTKDRFERKYPITDALFNIRNASEVFDALHPSYPNSKWCEGVGTYLKQYFSSLLSGYEEIEDFDALFYEGEFLLTLTPVIAESESGIVRGHISSGSYLFYSEASHILENFLRNNKELLKEIFGSQLKQVLENFEEYAPKMGNRGGCWGDGMPRSAASIIFPPAKIVEA